MSGRSQASLTARLWRSSRPASALGLSFSVGGCDQGGAPSIPIFGAYFPLWLISAVAGVIAAFIFRAVFAKLGLDAVLRFRLSVYLAIAVICGSAVYFWFV